MQVHLAYGRDGLDVEIPDSAVIIEPEDAPGIADERAAFVEGLRSPIGARALREIVRSHESVCIVTSDITRATPNERLIPWILDELAHVPAEQIVVVIGTGSHRGQTEAEIVQMFGAQTARRVRIVNHDAADIEQTVVVGTTSEGQVARLNRLWVEADRRIVVGFIEPHLYAGFSGGPKGVMPAIADIDTITCFHNARKISDPNTTWLNLEGSPVQRMSREVVAMCPPDFCANVTLNRRMAITGVFCGHYLEAHRRGCDFCRETASRRLSERFDVVVTTNGGYPLDQNLYQSIKGLAAAMGIVKKGGTIILACECSDGLPDHGNFKELIRSRATAHDLLQMILAPGFKSFDQWSAQSMAQVLLHARVQIKSLLGEQIVRSALLEPIGDVGGAIRAALAEAGAHATLAVLPEGPYTVPFVGVEAKSPGSL
ncbi:MAG: nickel-dependent lactate racemase [bacterium]|nr:nickel-dependent lactate racemase [bacterium]